MKTMQHIHLKFILRTFVVAIQTIEVLCLFSSLICNLKEKIFYFKQILFRSDLT